MSVEITDPEEVARRIMDWRNLSPLPTAYSSNKTTDPEARDYERSIELFREGLRAARQGDLQTGRTKIAAAYLLDFRCSRWYAPISIPREVDPEMQDCVLDFKLLMKLAGICHGPNDSLSDLNLQDNDPAPSILDIFLVHRNGGYQQNQELCALAFHATQNEIDKIAKDPSSYENNPRVLDGCLTRAAIHDCRANLYEITNNPKKAAREFRKALQLEPENYKLLAEYAMLNFCYALEELKTIVQDCKTVIANIHPDNRRLRHMYAILAFSFLEFPALGTFDQALAFYEQMKQCQQRQIYLYGEHELQLQGKAGHCREAAQRFDALTPQDKAARRAADTHMKCGLFSMQEQASLNEAGNAVKRLCMNCKTAPQNGVDLRKCSRCKQVAYCSKECQIADWKNHKRACKLHTKLKKEGAP